MTLNHLALIPDGNRRYAREHGKSIVWGHQQGAEVMERLVKWIRDAGIKELSIYALSTENLKRKELNHLWDIYKERFEKLKLEENPPRVNVYGNVRVWRPDVRKVARELMISTRSYTRNILNIMLAYGSRFEITHAVSKALGKGWKRIDEFMLVQTPVDLVVRTGGEHRLSNFLLYQSAYAEIYFEDRMFPDITKRSFNKWVRWYEKRDKRFGR